MRDERTGWLRLSTVEFALLWTASGFGDLPAVLGVRRVGRTTASRAALIEQASESMTARGLGTVARPATDLAGLLAPLADHDRSFDVLITGARAELRGMAVAEAGGGGVTVAVAGGEVRLGPVRPTALIGSLLDAVEPVPAGPGQTANVGWADYRRACATGRPSGFLDELRAAGVRTPEARTLLRAVTERRGGGQFGASFRTRDGRSTRHGETLSWVDTADGRYALRVRDGWLTVTPADMVKLSDMAAELVPCP